MINDTTATQNEFEWVAKVGKPAFDSILDMVNALECDYDRLSVLQDIDPSELTDDEKQELKSLLAEAGDCLSQSEAERQIHEDPLSIRVFGERCDGEWEATSYEILLSTGGPASRIVGDLDSYGSPTSASLEVQDWFKQWTEYAEAEESVLLTYASFFCFSE